MSRHEKNHHILVPVARSQLCANISLSFQSTRQLFFADLLHCTNEPNVSIPTLANLLIERTQNPSWVVVYKALITTHHLMCYGNEVTNCIQGASVNYIFAFSRGSPSIWPQATATFSSMASWTKREFRVSRCNFVLTGVRPIKVVNGQLVAALEGSVFVRQLWYHFCTSMNSFVIKWYLGVLLAFKYSNMCLLNEN